MYKFCHKKLGHLRRKCVLEWNCHKYGSPRGQVPYANLLKFRRNLVENLKKLFKINLKKHVKDFAQTRMNFVKISQEI